MTNLSGHNHDPQCCCPDLQRESYSHTCPQCPEHGELASLSEATPYPCCGQAHGEPHTDRCRQDAGAGDPSGWRQAVDPNN